MVTVEPIVLIAGNDVVAGPGGRFPGQKIAIGCAGAPVAPRSRIGVAVKRNW